MSALIPWRKHQAHEGKSRKDQKRRQRLEVAQQRGAHGKRGRGKRDREQRGECPKGSGEAVRAVVEDALSLQAQVAGAVPREDYEAEQAHQQRVGVEHPLKESLEVAPGVKRYPADHVPGGHAVEEGKQEAAQPEHDVPGTPPQRILDMMAELDRHPAAHQ